MDRVVKPVISTLYKRGNFAGFIAGVVAAAPFAVLYALGSPCRLAPLAGSAGAPFVGCGLPLSIGGLLVAGVVYGTAFWVGRTLYRGWRDGRPG